MVKMYEKKNLSCCSCLKVAELHTISTYFSCKIQLFVSFLLPISENVYFSYPLLVRRKETPETSVTCMRNIFYHLPTLIKHNFFYLFSLRQFYIISLLHLQRCEKTGWRQSLQDALCGQLRYLELAYLLLATLAADLFYSDREILVAHFALIITVQYPPFLKTVVLLEVNIITFCNKVTTVTFPL